MILRPDQMLRIQTWHNARFGPHTADPVRVGMKMVSEVGELCDAVLIATGNSGTSGKGDVGEESADVAICLATLLLFGFPDINLEDEVDKKLDIIEARLREMT